MENRSVKPDTLDSVELNELKTGEEPKFIEFLARINISTNDLENFPHRPRPDALNRLITAFNLGITDSLGVKNSLISIGLSYQDLELPPDYSPASVIKGRQLLDHLDLIVLVIAMTKVKAASSRAKL
ncbi:MAG: hypothetical protein WAV56_04595 [Microgenomates group bacterium]